MPQRDYILRLIEQVAQLLRRAMLQRETHSPQEALQSIMASCERLFGMEAVQLFQFTPDQHYLMLGADETPENARDKILIYAALNLEAGRCYTELAQPVLAHQTFLNALRLTLKARQQYATENWPAFAPSVDELLKLLGDAPLDADTAELLVIAGVKR